MRIEGKKSLDKLNLKGARTEGNAGVGRYLGCSVCLRALEISGSLENEIRNLGAWPFEVMDLIITFHSGGVNFRTSDTS